MGPEPEPMATFGYLVLVMAGSVVGAGLGALGHWRRANATPYPEKLFEDERRNAALSGADYVYERDLIKAEWDEGGWWEFHSLRNLAYYVLSGAAAPLLIGRMYWSERQASSPKPAAASPAPASTRSSAAERFGPLQKEAPANSLHHDDSAKSSGSRFVHRRCGRVRPRVW